jgi:hypothetical protein
VEVVMTMSFAEQLDRNRQSCQTTYTFPEPSTSAEGNGGERRPPATMCLVWLATGPALVQLIPPFVERNERISP